MNRFLISNFSSHLRTTFAVNSGPLSDLIWQGNPLFKNSSARTSTTSWALKCLLTFSARHSLVYSSIRVRILKDRPSWVRSATKSYDQTWFLNSGFKRKQDPSLNHNLDRLGCFDGTLSPSCLQILAKRLWLICQPSRVRSWLTCPFKVVQVEC